MAQETIYETQTIFQFLTLKIKFNLKTTTESNCA